MTESELRKAADGMARVILPFFRLGRKDEGVWPLPKRRREPVDNKRGRK